MSTAPITPSVAAWAIRESGYSTEEVAVATGSTPAAVAAWLRGTEQPTTTQARKLAQKVRRPFALLFRATPPDSTTPAVAFRAPIADEMRDLNPDERRYLRQAARLQEFVAIARRELDMAPVDLPVVRTTDDPETAARAVRDRLGVTASDQAAWQSEYEAMRAWREAVERMGILVFALPLGSESCRGMALASEWAPIVVANTHWNHKARIFTLFHEIGHLLSRSTSACASSWSQGAKSEPCERWCEEFAAALLMPWEGVEDRLRAIGAAQVVGSVDDVSSLARHFKVSLQAVTIRLISKGRARWTLWKKLPRQSNKKQGGGGSSDEPRTQDVARLSEFGRGAIDLLLRGLHAEKLDRSQVTSHLRLSDEALSTLETKLGRQQ